MIFNVFGCKNLKNVERHPPCDPRSTCPTKHGLRTGKMVAMVAPKSQELIYPTCFDALAAKVKRSLGAARDRGPIRRPKQY